MIVSQLANPVKLSNLADRRICVIWRNVSRGRKSTKIPYNRATGRPAKADDPGTWGTMRDVLCEILGANRQ